jgi:pimeloyl-ACP methyl ester carboxylesterase
MGTREASGTVVLVHGGFVDGSGWHGVYDQLTENGYSVAVVQNPTLSLEGDVAATKQIIDAQSNRSRSSAIGWRGRITEAGTHSKVAALVYIAAFARTRASRSTPHRDRRREQFRAPIRCRRLSPRPRKVPCIIRGRLSANRPRSWPIRKCRGVEA